MTQPPRLVAAALRSALLAPLALLLLLLPLTALVAQVRDSLPDAQVRAQARCEAIPPGRGTTGMIFNPQGLRTVYERSQCFQELAIQLGEPALCERAVERRSLLFNGSGISPAACRRLVDQRLNQDRTEARTLQQQSVVSLALDVNSNGRDLDVLVGTSGGTPRPHRLFVSLVAPREVVLLDILQPLASTASELRHLLHAAALKDALGNEGDSFRVRAELRLEPRDLDERRVYRQMAAQGNFGVTVACRNTAGGLLCSAAE